MTLPPADRAYACGDCEHRWYYTRPRCPACGSDAVDTYELERGTVVATTVVHVTADDVREPNPLALVDFGDVSLIAQVEGDASADETVTFTGEYVLRGEGDDAVRGPRLRRVDE